MNTHPRSLILAILTPYLLWLLTFPYPTWACTDIVIDAALSPEQVGICMGGYYDFMDCQQQCTRTSQCRHEYCDGICEGGENHQGMCFFGDEQCPNGKCVHQCVELGRCINQAGDELLAILANFSVTAVDNTLKVAWETATEDQNQAMNVYCSPMRSGQFTNIIQLNQSSIVSKALLPFSGSQYTVTSAPLVPGVYYCALEDIDTAGQCSTHCDQLAAAIIGDSTHAIDLVAAQALCQTYVNTQKEHFGNTGSCIPRS